MNSIIGRSLAPYRPFIRVPSVQPIEQGYGSNPATRVATDVASLSLATRFDLSQKAQVLPPPPPPESRKKTPPPPNRKSENSAHVSTTDFTGRTCTGSLHGPLLMEDFESMSSLDSRPAGFQSVDFVFENPSDFAPLRSASLALSALQSEVLRAVASDRPLATVPASDSSFAYFGVKNGMALIVQQFENGQAQAGEQQNSQVRLPDGQLAYLSRHQGLGGDLSIYLPATSLSEMVTWGRSLLAEA